MKYLITIMFTLQLTYLYGGNSFTCPYGTQGACLDYSDKVCSSMAKCVDSSAICFDSYTCDYKGFICKSKFDNLANSCQDLASDYDNLVNKYNDLKDNAEDLLNQYEDLESKYNRQMSCISNATTLEEIKLCY